MLDEKFKKTKNKINAIFKVNLILKIISGVCMFLVLLINDTITKAILTAIVFLGVVIFVVNIIYVEKLLKNLQEKISE
ncbi:MAG: hypothetical protein IJZ29_04280 [Clostridia bacterium]|nr:hypothetical protein [Clostridia bacterium]